MSPVPRSGEVAGRRFHSRTLSVCSNGQRAGLCCAVWLMRLPQEDFCKALGVAPHLKYEADGGPGVRSMAPVLRNSVNSAKALRTFVAMQLLLGMLAAPDGHAKNFSRQRLAGDAIGGPCWTTSCLSSRSKTRSQARGPGTRQRWPCRGKTTTITSRTSSAGTLMPWAYSAVLARMPSP